MAKSKPVVVLSAVTTVCLMAIGVLVAGEWAVRYRERHRDTEARPGLTNVVGNAG